MTGHVDGLQRPQQALRAAELYYMQDLTMDSIANEMGMSRSSISRLVKEARDLGMVSIDVHAPSNYESQLGLAIEKEFGVSAQIVAVPENVNDIDRLERVALSAARAISKYIQSNMIIGVSWGATLSAVSQFLMPKATRGSTIVQVNGAANITTTGISYASEILRRFGVAYDASVQQFPVPAFFDDPETKKLLFRERSIRRVSELHERMDVVIFGVGAANSPVPSHVFAGNYISRDDCLDLQAVGAVGDVSTVFYRIDGSWKDIVLNLRAGGPDLDTIRRTPRRICVAAGRAKGVSLKGALAGGLVTNLILDESAALALLDSSF
jgi:deoxyribonucleoside regulator